MYVDLLSLLKIISILEKGIEEVEIIYKSARYTDNVAINDLESDEDINKKCYWSKKKVFNIIRSFFQPMV